MRGPSQIAGHVRRAALEQPPTLGDGDCEALRPGLIGQPANTVTSFAYAGCGLWSLSWVRSLEPSQRPGALAYSALTVLTGAGSVAYHGPQFAGAQSLHDLPIVGVVAVGGVVPLARLRSGRAPLPGWSRDLGTALGATTALAAVAYVAGRSTSPLCRPRSLLQPHGLWHLCTAAAIGMWARAVWPPSDPSGVNSATDG